MAYFSYDVSENLSFHKLKWGNTHTHTHSLISHVPASLLPRKESRIMVFVNRIPNEIIYLFLVALRAKAVYGLLILAVSRSHSATHHSR